jgi:hypothetical protein
MVLPWSDSWRVSESQHQISRLFASMLLQVALIHNKARTILGLRAEPERAEPEGHCL